MSTLRLSLHDERRTTTPDGVPSIGLRKLVIRDQHGRELEYDAMVWGPVDPALAEVFGPTVETGADYLMIAIRIEGAIRD